jgi:hypothetical protein
MERPNDRALYRLKEAIRIDKFINPVQIIYVSVWQGTGSLTSVKRAGLRKQFQAIRSRICMLLKAIAKPATLEPLLESA